MRKTSCRKKLTLRRETVQRLESRDLRDALGATETDSVPSCIDGCPTVFTCGPQEAIKAV